MGAYWEYAAFPAWGGGSGFSLRVLITMILCCICHSAVSSGFCGTLKCHHITQTAPFPQNGSVHLAYPLFAASPFIHCLWPTQQLQYAPRNKGLIRTYSVIQNLHKTVMAFTYRPQNFNTNKTLPDEAVNKWFITIL